MKTIQLFNPEKFGVSMAGISFRETGGECLLVVFRDKKIVFRKYYAEPGNAKRGFANRFKNDNGVKPLWPDFNLNFTDTEANEDDENLTEQAASYIFSLRDEELQNLDSRDVAAAIQTDLNQLVPVFEKDQKTSIPNFIEREKVYRAYFLLNKGIDITIPELAKRLGFATIVEFEKSFEKYICIKPGKYKELIKINGGSMKDKDDTKDLSQKVCRRLKDFIGTIKKKDNLSLDEFAKEVNIPPERLKSYEKGEIYPDLNDLVKISQYRGLNLNWLLCENGGMFFAREKDMETAIQRIEDNGNGRYEDYLRLLNSMGHVEVEDLVLDFYNDIANFLVRLEHKTKGKEQLLECISEGL